MFRTSNPVLNENTFAGNRWGGIMADLEKSQAKEKLASTTMTIRGTVAKTSFLLALCVASSIASWTLMQTQPSVAIITAIGGSILGIVLSLVMFFRPQASPFLAPIYALAKGCFLGAISHIYSNNSGKFEPSIVVNAVGLTFGIFAALLAIYATGLVRIGGTALKVIMAATFGVFLLYASQAILGMFGVTFVESIHKGGPIGIGFSIFVIVLASLNLVMDFQTIEDGAKAHAPKFMEWYTGFGLLVTLIWLYIEILRLLDKLRK
jgi:uncharacterized YccA/Bax inhibitor family protein